ncbi:MAG: hypothetical protein WC758_04250 [Candidatus Woesearchaeota archaeon]|jgi:hypothetical protein
MNNENKKENTNILENLIGNYPVTTGCIIGMLFTNFVYFVSPPIDPPLNIEIKYVNSDTIKDAIITTKNERTYILFGQNDVSYKTSNQKR